MVLACNLGFPRIGSKRQLKKGLEDFWSGKIGEEELVEIGRKIRSANWQLQSEAGLDHIPSNDFSFYDHVLDTAVMLGIVPDRFSQLPAMQSYFAMARGSTIHSNAGSEVRPLKMKKWFNTNYHYLVPELSPRQKFHLRSTKAVDEFLEAKALGIITRPVIVGPVSFLLLSKAPLNHLPAVIAIYGELIERLRAAGAEWIQFDEPFIATDLSADVQTAYIDAYTKLSEFRGSARLLITTYFDDLKDNNLFMACRLPVDGLHVDLCSCQSIDNRDSLQGKEARKKLEQTLSCLPGNMSLSAGIIDGRNVFKAHLRPRIELLESIAERIGPERLQIAPSCSLIHVPYDLALETELDADVHSWLSFARQKLQEISILADALCCGKKDMAALLEENDSLWRKRIGSQRSRNSDVRQRIGSVHPGMYRRKSAHAVRKRLQADSLRLPPLPTTTIGSFPQTADIRKSRSDFKTGKISQDEYNKRMREEIANAVSVQEKIGIDVLVHGEPERSDMVEYFAEKLNGIATTKAGWVQSYGSRCIRPPIIFGDVFRSSPMTVEWISYAQSLTKRPMKGMLTGPVTMQQWAFVRDDEPREMICRQLALAILDEVKDLEAAGIKIIQIDEPAFREGAPMQVNDRAEYFRWAVSCFQLACASASDATQIHTHMCYSDFEEIMNEIAEMDADVITIEASRSQMSLLSAFRKFEYPNDIGPGFFDVHSPLVPTEDEIEGLIREALAVLPPDKLWVNPDCGLKTRRWQEVVPALNAMVRAAHRARRSLAVRA